MEITNAKNGRQTDSDDNSNIQSAPPPSPPEEEKRSKPTVKMAR